MSLYNTVINCRFNELEKYSNFILNVSGKKIDYITVISNALILAQKHEPKSIDEAKAILFHYIKCEVLYKNTASQKELITSVEYDNNLNEIEFEECQFDLHDIINTEVEQWDFINKNFFKKFMQFKLEKKTIKDLADFYNIDYIYAKKKVNKLKKRIRCKI